MLDENKGKVGWLKIAVPWENKELLDFKEYLKNKLLSIISCIFRNEFDNPISEFALQNMKEKIDKMHARDEWSFEDINFEYQNLNYYLTNLDVLHLTEGMHINPLECQDLSFDHRHFLFHNLKWSNNAYNSILNKRNLIYEGLKNIYIELTMSQAKIFIEKWYYGKKKYYKFRCS